MHAGFYRHWTRQLASLGHCDRLEIGEHSSNMEEHRLELSSLGDVQSGQAANYLAAMETEAKVARTFGACTSRPDPRRWPS